MTDSQMDLLCRSRESLSAAKMLLENAYPDLEASRAYYAMFYAAEAFLEGEGLSFSKHSAVISAFGKEFARTGRVPTEMHRQLVEAEKMRHVADYGPRKEVSVEMAAEQIERAEQFFKVAQQLIGPISE